MAAFASYPDIDIFLPICGESLDLLHNTWVHVFELVQAYMGKATAYVLDDGADPRARALAADFGFRYAVVRDNRPWMNEIR